MVRELGETYNGTSNPLANMTIAEIRTHLVDGEARVSTAIAQNDKSHRESTREIKGIIMQIYSILRGSMSDSSHDACMMVKKYRDNEDGTKDGNSDAFTLATVMYQVHVTKTLGQTDIERESHRQRLEDAFRNSRQQAGQSRASYVGAYMAAEKELHEAGGRSISVLTNQMQFIKGLDVGYQDFKKRYETGLMSLPTNMQDIYNAADVFKGYVNSQHKQTPGSSGKVLTTGQRERQGAGQRDRPAARWASGKGGKPELKQRVYTAVQTANYKRRERESGLLYTPDATDAEAT